MLPTQPPEEQREGCQAQPVKDDGARKVFTEHDMSDCQHIRVEGIEVKGSLPRRQQQAVEEDVPGKALVREWIVAGKNVHRDVSIGERGVDGHRQKNRERSHDSDAAKSLGRNYSDHLSNRRIGTPQRQQQESARRPTQNHGELCQHCAARGGSRTHADRQDAPGPIWLNDGARGGKRWLCVPRLDQVQALGQYSRGDVERTFSRTLSIELGFRIDVERQVPKAADREGKWLLFVQDRVTGPLNTKRELDVPPLW